MTMYECPFCQQLVLADHECSRQSKLYISRDGTLTLQWMNGWFLCETGGNVIQELSYAQAEDWAKNAYTIAG